MNINTTDITFLWGEAVNPHERLNGKWRQALYQDISESFNSKFLYFLYDKGEDENCQTTGNCKGPSGLIIFDTESRCFAGNIPLHFPGTLKFLFSLKCPSPQMGASLILVTEELSNGVNKLHIYRLNMDENGLFVAEMLPVLLTPITINGEYICAMREDVPEIIVLAGPGLQVYRINCLSEVPSNPVGYFFIPEAELSHFYDGFVHKGYVVLLSAHKDCYLDWSRVHAFPIEDRGKIVSHFCSPDPDHGYPPARKECGIDTFSGGIMVAGGEFVEAHDAVTRLRDYWMLDLSTHQWKMLPGEMPCDLIEPRVTVTNTGNIYLWGDYDVPMPDLPLQHGTHVRIFKVTGLEKPHLFYPNLDLASQAQQLLPASLVAAHTETVVDPLPQQVPSEVKPVEPPTFENSPNVPNNRTEMSFEDPVYRSTVEDKKKGKKHRKFCCFQ